MPITRLVRLMFALAVFCLALEAHAPDPRTSQPFASVLVVCGYDAALLPDMTTMGAASCTNGFCLGAHTNARTKYLRSNSRFTGKERDAETGLDYFGARYMSAAQGRFTSPDLPFADQHAEDPQSWNLYSYVRNNPLRYTDPTGRCLRPNETLQSCGDYLLGGLKTIANIPSDTVNLPNRLANVLITPFTDFGFQDLVPTTFQPSNADQAQGMEAMGVALVATPLAEAAAGKAVQVIGTGAVVESGANATKTGVQANKLAGDAFRDQVAAGLSAEGRGVQTEVYKKTPFGGRRIDIEVSDRPGGTTLGGIEAKAGGSPYKPSQRAKDEYLRRQGYPVNVVREPKKR